MELKVLILIIKGKESDNKFLFIPFPRWPCKKVRIRLHLTWFLKNQKQLLELKIFFENI